jgi:magnesium transporter
MPIIDCAVYQDGRRRPGSLPLMDALEASRQEGAFVWIGLYEPTTEEFEAVRQEFHLHELAVEDAIKAHQRAKVEMYGDTAFVVLKTARYDRAEHEIEFGELLLFVGQHFLITVRHGETALHTVRTELEARPDLLRIGPAAALYAIMDRVVDDYFPVVDGLNDDISAVEAEVFSESRQNPSEHIYRLKREVLDLYAAVSALPEELDKLARGQYAAVSGEILPYFRDVHDHLLRLVSQVDNFRELLTNVLTANLTQITVRQNDDMRRISAWAAMVAVPTMIAGIYGMNFEHMPELGWRYGYPAVLIVMALICFGLYRYFRKIGWL